MSTKQWRPREECHDNLNGSRRSTAEGHTGSHRSQRATWGNGRSRCGTKVKLGDRKSFWMQNTTVDHGWL